MRVLFLISDTGWSGRARAFVLAARGLAARGHEVRLACHPECPVQLRAAAADLPIVPLASNGSVTRDTMQLRRALHEHAVDVVFVHTDAEQLVASSAVRLGRSIGAVIRRVPPFATTAGGTRVAGGSRLATRIAANGLLFSSEADRTATDGARHRIPAAVAPLSVDPAEHDQFREVTKAGIGVPPESRLIVCVYDGADRAAVFAFLRTLSVIAPRHPELHVVVIGDARLDEARMHGAALGVNSMVTYLGGSPHEMAIMRAADVGWIAAAGDAAAFAALDFMAYRTPVLAERSTLMEHYVTDGVGGILLKQSEPTTMAASVAAFLATEDRRQAMGRAGRARLEREFSYDAMIAGYERAISGAVERDARLPAAT